MSEDSDSDEEGESKKAHKTYFRASIVQTPDKDPRLDNEGGESEASGDDE